MLITDVEGKAAAVGEGVFGAVCQAAECLEAGDHRCSIGDDRQAPGRAGRAAPAVRDADRDRGRVRAVGRIPRGACGAADGEDGHRGDR